MTIEQQRAYQMFLDLQTVDCQDDPARRHDINAIINSADFLRLTWLAGAMWGDSKKEPSTDKMPEPIEMLDRVPTGETPEFFAWLRSKVMDWESRPDGIVNLLTIESNRVLLFECWNAARSTESQRKIRDLKEFETPKYLFIETKDKNVALRLIANHLNGDTKNAN
jgi:hypothetical protein